MKAWAELVVLSLLGSNGCSSYALMQTAHTTPPGKVRLLGGVSRVDNQYKNQEGRPSSLYTSAEVQGRVGLTEQLDLGLTPFMGKGAAVDGKLNLIPNDKPLALAPRLRVGAGTWEGSRDIMAEGGLVVSYRITEGLEPYGALSYADHFIRYAREDIYLEPNQSLVESRGYGDGVLEGVVGVMVRLSGRASLSGEYQYWEPLNNDPGDGYAFAKNHIFTVGAGWQSP